MTLFEAAPGCGKRNYDSLKAAQRAAVSIHKRAGQQLPDAYHCKACGSYHFGRNPKKQKEPNMLAMTETKRAATLPPAVENRELSWLAQRVAQGRKQPFSEIANITPTIAKHILDYNPQNRLLRQGKIDEICSDILSGRWEMNGESVIIADTGELNDGQHRLLAIVQANKGVKTTVIFGVPRDSRFTVDMGAARTSGDFLGMDGVGNAKNIAAAAKIHNLYRRGLYSDGGKSGTAPTKTMIRAEYLQRNKGFDRAASFVAGCKFLARYGGSGLICAHVILHEANYAAASMFFDKLASGDELGKSDPILLLRNRLYERLARRSGVPVLEMILRHWNAWIKNKPMSKYYPKSEFPKVER
jgi:hypothetical protein